MTLVAAASFENQRQVAVAPATLILVDPAMRALDEMTTAVAAGDISVLITGETGTGK